MSRSLRQWYHEKYGSKPPALLKYRSSKSFIVFVVTLAVFTDIFLYGVIVPVIPTAITQRAGVLPEDRQKIISVLLGAYGLALLVSSPLFGVVADHTTSRRGPFLVGLLALGGATVMLCVGRSVALLVAGRILQGISAATVWTVGTALVVDTVESDEVGQAMGFISLGLTGGTVMGPLLGGAVYYAVGYYGVFGMSFAIVAVDIVLRFVMIERKRAKKWTSSDPQQNYGTIGIGPSQQQDRDGSRVSERRESSPPRHSDRSSSPGGDHQEEGELEGERGEDGEEREHWRRLAMERLPPVLWLLTYPRLLCHLLGSVIQSSMLIAFDAVSLPINFPHDDGGDKSADVNYKVLPLFTMETFGWNTLSQGAIFLALFLPTTLSPLVGRIADKYNPRYIVATGFMLAIPLYILLRLITHDDLGQKILLGALLALIGLSHTLIMAPLMTDMNTYVSSIEKDHPDMLGEGQATAQANGLYNCAFAAGTLIGPSVAGFVKARFGWGAMGLTLGLMSAVMAVITLVAACSGSRRPNNSLR